MITSVMSWYFRQRHEQLMEQAMHAVEIQEETFHQLMLSAEQTEYGKLFDAKSISDPEKFRKQFPIAEYEDLKPWIERTMQGEQGLIWPGEITWFAKSSGTTGNTAKFIPVSFEALEECHFQGGRDVLTAYFYHFPESKIFNGKGLLIGGSHRVNQTNNKSFYGDLSAVLMNHLPAWASLLKTPDLSIALMENWEEKLEKMAYTVIHEQVTSISGVPTWTLVLFKRLLEITGKQNILEVWPNLELYIHGGVSFVPYKEQFKSLLPSDQMHYLETYNASEGFFGLQIDEQSDDMLLLTHYGIFYEFIPLSQIFDENPLTLTLSEVKTGENYAVIITTNSGLWRYKIGDTIKFTSVNPFRFIITGRTKLFINAFGEELVIDNAEKAMAIACATSNAKVVDYTAAPIYMNSENPGHEWLIEFEIPPENLTAFAEILDSALKSTNSDYAAKRHADLAMKMPKLKSMPSGTFHSWLKSKGKLGGQHKVPRLCNDRTIIEEIIALSEPGRA